MCFARALDSIIIPIRDSIFGRFVSVFLLLFFVRFVDLFSVLFSFPFMMSVVQISISFWTLALSDVYHYMYLFGKNHIIFRIKWNFQRFKKKIANVMLCYDFQMKPSSTQSNSHTNASETWANSFGKSNVMADRTMKTQPFKSMYIVNNGFGYSCFHCSLHEKIGFFFAGTTSWETKRKEMPTQTQMQWQSWVLNWNGWVFSPSSRTFVSRTPNEMASFWLQITINRYRNWHARISRVSLCKWIGMKLRKSKSNLIKPIKSNASNVDSSTN